MINYLIMDGKPSIDFGLVISGRGVHSSSEKRYEELDIPGRNGKLLMNTDNYFDNVQVNYESFMYEDQENVFAKYEYMYADGKRSLSARLHDLRSFLGSRNGYFRIEDTYNRDEYRIGYYRGPFEPEINRELNLAQFTLTFVCKPQRFLKQGDETLEFTSSSSINNPTRFDSKPLIRAYGTGSFIVGGTTVAITSADVYTDIDCDLMECYKGSVNCNGNVTLTNGEFPSIPPGESNIVINGNVTKLEIIPKWWTL